MIGNSHSLKNHGAVVVEECRFEDVLPIWQTKLWPGRVSKIESHSAMKWLGGIDLDLMNAPAFFCRLRLSDNNPNSAHSGRVIGVLSGHFGGLIELDGKKEVRSYRTRGLFVEPEFRGLGAAGLLMSATLSEAKRQTCEVAWTFPRQSVMPAYQKMGFKMIGQWIGENDPGAGEFGPNCYAIRHLTP